MADQAGHLLGYIRRGGTVTAADPLPPREIVTPKDEPTATEIVCAFRSRAGLLSGSWEIRLTADIASALARVRQTERERAAGIVDGWKEYDSLEELAAAIRAGEKPDA